MQESRIAKNPVQLEGRPGENPEGGAEPFSPEEIMLLRQHAGPDLLSFLVLRWTGFRGSDAVALPFREIHFECAEIERITLKRKKKVTIPLRTELIFALEAERDSRNSQGSDPVLLNPSTGRPLTRPRLYQRMVALGRRAGVPNVHPHRFRDTFAVQHYMPFVRELRERVRSILENGVGMEELAVTPADKTTLKSSSKTPSVS